MFYSPAIQQSARQLRVYLPIPFLLAGAVYLVTLSHGVTPGISAALTAMAAGMGAPSGAAHPLFAWATRLAASTGVFTLPERLNLFSALCGALCAMLAYHVVARLIFFTACDDVESNPKLKGRRERPPSTAATPELPIEFTRHNNHIRRIAVWSGLLASFLLLFSAPFWTASTRLDRGPFDLLLALAAMSLFPTARTAWRIPRLMASVTVFTCGLLETPVFLFLLPGYAFLLFKIGLASHRPFAMLARYAVAVVVGWVIMLAAFRFNTDSAAALSGSELLSAFMRTAPFSLYREARAFFPKSGWAFPLLQVGFAAALVMFGRKALFHQKRAYTLIVLALLTLSVLPGLLLLPVAPHFIFLPADHLPVFAHAVLALAVAVAFAACLSVLFSSIYPQPESTRPQDKTKTLARSRQRQAVRTFAVCLLPVLVLASFLSPLRSYFVVRASRVTFADAVACELLDSLQGRQCLVTNGALNHNLRIMASARKQPLVLISLQATAASQEQLRLHEEIGTHPLFAEHLRLRLQNALSISPMRLVSEWLSSDTNAYRHILIDAPADIWIASGFCPVPEGLAYSGLKPEQKPPVAQLVEQNRRFADKMAPVLSESKSARPPLYEALRISLSIRAGVAANELGVLLEDLGEPQAAFQAYSNALSFDPNNVSAALNKTALAIAKNMFPESHDQLKKRVKSLLADRRLVSRGLAGIVQRYGTVRQQAFYQQQAVLLNAAGVPAVASAKMNKALALSEQTTGNAPLLERALFCEQMGEVAKAESLYQATLADGTGNWNAYLGLCRLALERRDAELAAKWLQQSAAAGADTTALRAPSIDLALLNADLPRARTLLADATKQQPDNPRYWGQFAEVMVKQGDASQVKMALLPEMQKTLRPQDLYLVHAIRGTLLIQAGASTVKEGRLELLKSLAMRPAQPKVWYSVLVADMILGNSEFIETDARSLLRIEPEHALANCLLGSVLLARGMLKEAEDFLRRSLAKEPTANAYNDLAETLRLLKRPQEAEPFARQALTYDGRLSSARDTLASILCDLGKHEDAVQEARLACEFDPSRPVYQHTLLRILIKQGDADAARRQIQALEKDKFAIPADLLEAFRRLK